jgi:thiosulfate dehydrogenase (quinone) large subunit
MRRDNKFSKLQFTFMLLLRFAIGWHILYEGIAKLLDKEWSSVEFLGESQWILSGFAQWIISDPNVLSVVDFLNTWGLIAIGLGLIFGLFSRAASIAGALLLLIYYLNAPPLTGIEYSLPAGGNYIIVNETLIEVIALCVLALFPTSHIFGFDAFFNGVYKKERS